MNFFALLAILPPALFLLALIKRENQQKRAFHFVANGEKSNTRGRIVSKYASGMDASRMSYFCAYTYEVDGLRTIKGKCPVSEADYRRLQKNDVVDILYDPHYPQTSIIAGSEDMVAINYMGSRLLGGGMKVHMIIVMAIILIMFLR